MVKAYHVGGDDSREDVENMKIILLDNANLPLLNRARVCMVLGCSDTRYNRLDCATEGIHVVELNISEVEKAGDKVGTVEHELLEACQTVLQQVQDAVDEMGGQNNLDGVRAEHEIA